MKNVVLKPELRTPGGETVSIYLGDDWAGDLYLVYREGDVLTGTMQIDTSKVDESELDDVAAEVRSYVDHLNAALGVEESSVVMMYGDISSVIEMEPFGGEDSDEIEMITAADDDDDLYLDEEDCEDEYEFEGNFEEGEFEDDEVYTGEMIIDEEAEDLYHLSVVYKDGEHTKYQLHDDTHNPIGIVAVDEIADAVSGRVEFWLEPDEEQADDVARMLAHTFSSEETETISFTMNYEDQHLGDMHLQRRDFGDELHYF